MKTFDKEKWGQIRVKGHTRFILKQIVRRGVPMGLFVTVGIILLDKLTHSAVTTPGNLAASFFCFGIIFGYLQGEREWERCERAYEKA